ncbi:putative cytochrome d ubiquinol oxidase, subunit II [Bacteroidales bacterium KA00344]|nr:putative cytochrome d ubiquinol oxidase, subunit II [Bacteroidales bacterium KA00344]
MTYEFLQSYWWFVVSLMGAFLVFLLFVQGANSMIFSLGKTPEERRLVINSTGRKWEFTFTTLVTFGASFFASFPLFYSTSFGGAYWVWMLILFSFVVQAVSYEFQNKFGNLLGAKTFQVCLILNGIIGPLLLGGAVATFFNGSNFMVEKSNMMTSVQPVISSWANASGGLDVLLDVWAVVFGIAVFFLARILGILYINNNIHDDVIRGRIRKRLLNNTIAFLVTFLAFFIRTLLKDGFALDPATGTIFMEPYKYFNNLIEMWPLAIILLAGVLLLLFGIIRTLLDKNYVKGIWPAGIGVILVVLVLFLIVGWNNTAFYPSNIDLQHSLTIRNSSSSETTLRAMTYVSFLIPVIIAYMSYAWWSIDRKKLSRDELNKSEAY